MNRFHLAATIAVVILLGLTSKASAQPQGGGLFGRGDSLANLLQDTAIQTELKMTDEQIEKMGKKDEARRKIIRAAQELTAEKRIKRFEEISEELDITGWELIKDVLDEKQQERLEQIYLQVVGARAAVIYPDIAKKLNVDDEQWKEMLKIATKPRLKRFDFRNATSEERQKFFAEVEIRAEKSNAAILATMTPSQKEAFEKMQGEKFDFPTSNRNRGNP